MLEQLSQIDYSQIFSILFFVGFIFNIFLAFVIIFFERRQAGSTWAWLLVLFFLPIVGFILYLLFGRQINHQTIFTLNDEDRLDLERIVSAQRKAIDNGNIEVRSGEIIKHRHIIRMLLHNYASFLTTDNKVEILTDGRKKFDALLNDIHNATDHIHIQYYIFKKDGIGLEILNALMKKLEEGVEVKMLYDDIGSRTLSLSRFKQFKKLGGQVESFFPSKLPLINFRMNNRNHRKIVVIDGKIGYIGGFNVGDEYLGLDKKFGYWRDTHLRVEGDAVNALQLRFMMDWNSQITRDFMSYDKKYFPDVTSKGDIGIQIVSSGPDSSAQHIKNGYLKMITSAKKSIYIQSPYFIPDTSLLDALKIAAMTGVEVNIMIPNKPDHPFVYWATYSNVGELLDVDCNIFIYENGFIHTKMLLIDDEVASVGTANMDFRSFELNFEVNAFIYDDIVAKKLRRSFEDDVHVSSQLTKEIYDQRVLLIRVKEAIARLLSPIL
ncbi:cardiolipin synthase [Macrococcoides caseolyticum]|uniref:cardiolipin synthase n=1 Tax=Macrococcoides caseolyticum TaxID=69966 RepID=UPI000A28D3F7|nr:cardiolipin synthase [Macrococcus caseolyticus]ARQ05431.1 Cardiolipin synthase [Macrococcus caseolyticus]PKE05937.1 cardiolipin synthase [Macrococcus caseolyticus]PKE16120.1 cardiolipin synthase [Macrococcus caseolyticus]PKE23105.1 cardiolipin synthase [Macrococcus caseolyticus]PKE34980.1 cardiolipin synthase [Macrococcus caseolyticus]